MTRLLSVSRFLLICVLAMSFLAAGCSKRARYGRYSLEEVESFGMAVRDDRLPIPSGGLVLSVSGEPITIDEIIVPLERAFSTGAKSLAFENFSAQARPLVSRIVLNKTTDILLYKAALKSAPANINEMLEKAVESEVNRFVSNYGGDYSKAQKAIEEMGMDWKGYRDFQKKLLLTQSYMSQELSSPRPVSRRDMLDYYNAKKTDLFKWDAVLEFSLIDVVSAKLKPEDIKEDETAEQAVARIAQKLALQIGFGQDFADTAKKYSHGHNAAKGGKWDPVTLGSLAAPYDVLETHAEAAMPGDVVGPIEVDGHFFIMKLHKYRQAGFEEFADVQGRIEGEIQLMRQNEEFTKILEKVVSQANIAGMDRFTDFCVYEAYARFR